LWEKDLDVCFENILPVKKLAGHAVAGLTASNQLTWVLSCASDIVVLQRSGVSGLRLFPL
jgi:hypothetical protein